TLLVDANDLLIEFKDPGAVVIQPPIFSKFNTAFPSTLKALPTSEVIATSFIEVDLTNYSPTDIQFIQSRMKVLAIKRDGTNFILDEFDFNFGTNVISSGRILLNSVINR